MGSERPVKPRETQKKCKHVLHDDFGWVFSYCPWRILRLRIQYIYHIRNYLNGISIAGNPNDMENGMVSFGKTCNLPEHKGGCYWLAMKHHREATKPKKTEKEKTEEMIEALDKPETSIRYRVNRWLHARKVRELHKKLGIRSGDLVFEIGSFDGAIAETLHSLGAKVIMAEPQPEMCKKIRKRFENKDNWSLEQAGVGEAEGHMPFQISANLMASTFSKKFAEMSMKEDKQTYRDAGLIRITTLDAMIKKHGLPKYIKIDAEGYELQILKGLHSPVDFVCFEFHRSANSDVALCLKELKRLSSDYVYSLATTPDEWLSEKTILERIKNENTRGGDIFATTTKQTEKEQ